MLSLMLTLCVPACVQCPTKTPTAIGPQRVAIVLVEDDLVPGVQSRAALEFQLLDRTNPLSFATLLDEVSYGKFDLQGAFYPPAGVGYDWYHYSGVLNNPGELVTAAAQLVDPHLDFGQIERLLPFTPRESFYAGMGLRQFQTAEGCFTIPTSTAGNANLEHGWVLPGGNSATFNFAHEFGHTILKDPASGAFQISHSVALRNTTGAIYTTNPADFSKNYAGQGFMFNGKRHPDVMVKDEVGWLEPAQLAEIRKNGVFTMALRPVHESNTGEIQCIKVARATCATSDLDNICGGGNLGWYYIELRTEDGADPIGELDEVSVFVYVDAWRRTLAAQSPDTAGSSMLDMKPADWSRYALRMNDTFKCPVYGTKIQVLPSYDPNMVTVKVSAVILPAAINCVADLSGPGRMGIPDGVVDQHDADTVIAHLGLCSGGPGCLGDITGPNGVPNGVVDFLDLTLVNNSFGVCGE